MRKALVNAALQLSRAAEVPFNGATDLFILTEANK